jgi:hypothetical protein
MIPPVYNVPTPRELIDLEASELAILAALDATLDAAVAAVLVANAELLHPDPLDDCESHSLQICIAHRLVDDARLLRAIIHRYCLAIYRSRADPLHDHDVDF